MSGNNIVTFSSLEFIFRFLPLFLVVFYVVPFRYRKVVLFLGSILFYALGDLRYLVLLLGLTALNYVLGSVAKKRRSWCFLLAVLLDLSVLVFFKWVTVTDVVTRPDGSALFVMPIGLSFYLFKMLSYQVDCYQNRLQKHGFLDAAVYFCMFPQLVSGPIMRMEEMEQVFDQSGQNSAKAGWKRLPARLERGTFYFVCGLCAKVLLADKLGILWHELASIGYESISMPLAWMGAVAYSLQLYFDFAGYSLMAAGLGVMLGFPFIQNFDHPYASCSVREFFRRWHMTLGNWFRDYIYIPLGGNRKGKGRLILHLAVVWLLTGIWHGVTVNFLLWSSCLFVLIVVEKFWLGQVLEKHRLFGHLYIVCLMPVTWMLFAINDGQQLLLYLGRMFPFLESVTGNHRGIVRADDFVTYGKLYAPFLLAGILGCLPPVMQWLERRRRKAFVILGMLLLFWSCIYQLSIAAGNPFLYFSF